MAARRVVGENSEPQLDEGTEVSFEEMGIEQYQIDGENMDVPEIIGAYIRFPIDRT